MTEFQVAYSRVGGSENVQFSSVGLHHMRTVLGMEIVGTQPNLPPVCHATSERLNKTNPYTFEDFKRDVELRASFFKPEKVIVSPLLPPPHPSRVAALMLRAEADASCVKGDKQGIVQAVRGGENCEKNRDTNSSQASRVSTPSKSAVSSPSLLSTSKIATSIIKTQMAGVLEDVPGSSTAGDASSLQDDRCHSRKSPSLCQSDVSLDGSLHDSSLTSYQIPRCHGHSTPVLTGTVTGSGEREEPVKEEEGGPEKEESLPLTPLRAGKTKVIAPKPRPLLVRI